MVGLQTLDLAIGVRVPASQPSLSQTSAVVMIFVIIISVARLDCSSDFPAAHLTGLASRTVVKINSMRPAKLD
jgi:hypothetical protein